MSFHSFVYYKIQTWCRCSSSGRALASHARDMGINTPRLQFIWVQDYYLKTIILVSEFHYYKSNKDIDQIDDPKIVEIFWFCRVRCERCGTPTWLYVTTYILYQSKRDSRNQLHKLINKSVSQNQNKMYARG